MDPPECMTSPARVTRRKACRPARMMAMPASRSRAMTVRPNRFSATGRNRSSYPTSSEARPRQPSICRTCRSAGAEHAPAHGAERQKGRAAHAVLPKVLDHDLGVLLAGADEVLHRAAQGHLHGALDLLGHAQQPRDHAVEPRRAAEAPQHLAHGVLVPLVVALHLLEHLQARLRLAQRAGRALDVDAELLALHLQGGLAVHGAVARAPPAPRRSPAPRAAAPRPSPARLTRPPGLRPAPARRFPARPGGPASPRAWRPGGPARSLRRSGR